MTSGKTLNKNKLNEYDLCGEKINKQFTCAFVLILPSFSHWVTGSVDCFLYLKKIHISYFTTQAEFLFTKKTVIKRLF